MSLADPDLPAIRRLEERAFNAWPALQTIVDDGWLLRLAGGATKRANSVNALAPQGPFRPLLDFAETLYRTEGLPTIFRLSPLAGAEPDVVLQKEGFRLIAPCQVMTRSIAPSFLADPSVALSDRASEAWRQGIAEANAIPDEQRHAYDLIVAAIRPTAAFALLQDRGEPAAFGLAVAERGMLGLFDIVTRPAFRRRGLARRLVGSLLAWGRSVGASEAYLQVVSDNHAAVSLYRKLGFTDRYGYHYRIKDESGLRSDRTLLSHQSFSLAK